VSALLAVASVSVPKITYLAILPELILLGGAVVLLGVSSVIPRPLRAQTTTALTLLIALASLSASLVQWYDVTHHGPHVTIASAVVQDGFSALVAVAVSCAVFLSALVADGWMRREHTVGPEFDVLMLVSASGAMIMGAANDLIVVFLGLEILSIALYVLAAMNARHAESGEAALKYFVLGSFSSAVFVYGVSLVYGATGSTNLDQIADFLARNVMLHNSLLLAGLALLLVGFGFKVAAVPFHLWTPDVYQGAPTPITGFMAAVAKIGGFAALLRVFLSSFGLLRDDWQPAVWVLAALTLLFGAVVALAQRDIKRMLAYSSINHAGFVLLGLQAATVRGPENGVQGSLYYLFVYVFMVIGSFAVVTVVGGSGDTRHDLDRYRGLARARPWLAGSLAVLLMAQAGIPFTTGFWAKLEVISASVGAGSTALAVISMVSAAIAAFFYLRVILLVYAPAGGSAVRPGAASDATAPSDQGTGGDEYAASTAAGRPWAGPRSGAATLPRAARTETAGAAPKSGTADAHEVDDETLLADLDDETTPAEVDAESTAVSPTVATAIGLCVGVTVLFGVWPAPLLDFAHQATLLLH
jgi:NADH-quinone oxidoreductase subunit N